MVGGWTGGGGLRWLRLISFGFLVRVGLELASRARFDSFFFSFFIIIIVIITIRNC